MKKQYLILLTVMALCGTGTYAQKLVFDITKGQPRTLTMPNGTTVSYTAYTDLYYVTNIEDPTYQRMHIFIPEGADKDTPIFMPNYVGGYMAAAAREVNPGDASGRALAEGYVVVIPGARGRNSTVYRNGERIYTGRAPKALLDLKAAVRYLRYFDDLIPGNAERIITDGTSAGGAMSSLLGSTGNNPAYREALLAMGAADTRDDVYASVCFCPIVDLDHADMAYEWLYRCTNGQSRTLTPAQEKVSEELAGMFKEYFNGLGLKKPDGTPLNESNCLDYIKDLIIASAQEAKDSGAELPDDVGLVYGNTQTFQAPVNGGMRPINPPPAMDGNAEDRPQNIPLLWEEAPRVMTGMPHRRGEYITDLDMDTYLNYVASAIALKTPPAFDSQGVAGGRASGENEEFGDEYGSSVNFTAYSLAKAEGKQGATPNESLSERVRLLNPLSMMTDSGSTVAPYWYIRHGAKDRDTAFPVPVSLAVKLQNLGCNVNFKLPWNRPHSGDYALNELFAWIKSIVE